MWRKSETEVPAESGRYLCVFECSGRNGCGLKCSDTCLMKYNAQTGTATVYGIKCRYHGEALYQVTLDGDRHNGTVTAWQPLPERD